MCADYAHIYINKLTALSIRGLITLMLLRNQMTVTSTDREVKLLRLLLIGPSFGQAGLTEIGFAEGGLDRLHAVAVVEALRDVVVLHRHHVLDGGQSGLHGFLHLMGSKGRKDIKQKLQLTHDEDETG